ncbi:GNAT family N-acetyltransferase [Haloarcula sp. CGMCC 1.2071]|uniref:GNAT family N-acetyltransferase n=1 Tax=Haloarcula sp. CGMCC 1.2071 TaxID=3111454 RepID=UPI00300EFC1B
MEIRPANSEDRQRVETLARDSFRTSYALSPQQIETIVENEFDDETLADRLADPDTTVLVAEHAAGDTEQVQGFIDVAGGTERTIRWLHVDPEARGEGIATALLEGVQEDDDGTPLVARILEDAVEGGEFLEDFDLESDDNAHVTFGNEEFAVAVFTEGEGTEDANEPSVPVPESVTVDGTARPIERDETVPGREAPFFSTYMGEDRTDQYGYFCSNCGSTDVSGDGLDRLECSECGNLHLADEWDDSYL